jgi:Zn-dependent protease with chaperone function
VIAALALLGYAACAAWCAPALLAPLTSRGTSVRAGLAAWLAAMASVLLSAGLAIAFSVAAVAADWPQLTRDLCRSVAGQECTPQVYGSALYQVGVAVFAVLLTLLSAVALWRYARRVQRSRAQTRSHARAALLVGHAITGPAASGSGPASGGMAADEAGSRPVAGRRARTVMLDDPRPAAYCAAGRPAAIVVTSGALAVLDPPQLRAVLAHERAHLAHGHHALATVVRGLAAAFPGVPLFTRGAAEVATLAEMSADDSAARTSGRETVATALLALATRQAVPGALAAPALPAGPLSRTALAAAADAVPARVGRLLAPARPGAALIAAALLTAISALLVLAPAVVGALVR